MARDYLDEKQALARAQRLCSRREKCISEIRKNLLRWNVEPKSMEGIIKTLVDQGYIDESRYAETFARDKVRLNKWGLKKIEYALKSKGIPVVAIQSAIDEIKELVTMDSIRELLEKKAKTIKYSNDEELKMKLIRFGLSRGFAYNELIEAVNQITNQ